MTLQLDLEGKGGSRIVQDTIAASQRKDDGLVTRGVAIGVMRGGQIPGMSEEFQKDLLTDQTRNVREKEKSRARACFLVFGTGRAGPSFIVLHLPCCVLSQCRRDVLVRVMAQHRGLHR